MCIIFSLIYKYENISLDFLSSDHNILQVERIGLSTIGVKSNLLLIIVDCMGFAEGDRQISLTRRDVEPTVCHYLLVCVEVNVHPLVGWLCQERNGQNVFTFWQLYATDFIVIATRCVGFLFLLDSSTPYNVWSTLLIVF